MMIERRPSTGCAARAESGRLTISSIVLILLLALSGSLARAAENPRLIAVAAAAPAPAFPAEDLSTFEMSTLTQRIDLWLEAGDRVSTVAGDRCEAAGDGDGDEVCAFTIVIEAASGMILRECDRYYYPGPTSPADPYSPRVWLTTADCAVTPPNFEPDPALAADLSAQLDQEAGTLTLTWLGESGPIESAPTRLGSIFVELHSLEGELRVAAQSEAVSSGLDLVGVNPDYAVARIDPGLPVPEPGFASGLLVGVIAIVAGRRRRANAFVARAAALVACLALGLGLSARPVSAQFYSLETGAGGFVPAAQALGGTLQHLSFDDVPAGGGSAVLENGDRLRQVTFTSLSNAASIGLDGFPATLFGTFLLQEYGPIAGQYRVFPGGPWAGPGARTDDDARLAFDFPVRAAGIRIDLNTGAPGEWIRFEGRGGFVVHQQPIDPGAPEGFYGYVLQPGDRPIVAIVIEESDADGSSLAFDDVYYETSGADPFADQLRGTNIVIDGAGQPTAEFRDPADALGPPDSDWVALGVGGSIELEFTDGRLTKSGNAFPDLKIYEPGTVPETFDVELTANGQNWYALAGPFFGGQEEVRIDLDATVGLPNHRYRAVRITDLSSGLGLGESIGVDVDAIEILSGRLRPPDRDNDRVPNVWDNCPDLYNPNQIELAGALEGRACTVPARVILERKSPTLPARAEATLKIECGSQPVERLLIGVWQPPGTGSLEFGPGLDNPPCSLPGDPPDAVAPFIPSGGPGCSGSVVGPTVLPGASGVFGVGVTSAAGFTTRPDVVYITLHGAAPSGYLCDPDDPMSSGVVDLIDVRTTMAATDTSQVLSLDSTFNFQSGEPICGTCNSPCEELPSDLVITTTDPDADRVTLSLVPLRCDLTEPVGADNVWSIWANAPGDFVHRASLGFLGPESVTTSQLFLEGCVSDVGCGVGVPGGGEVGDPGNTVDEDSSFARGPEILTDPDLLRDAIYAVLAGGEQLLPTYKPVMTTTNLYVCIGEIENNALVLDGAPPIPIRDGLLDLDYAGYSTDPTAPQEPFVTAFNTSYEIVPEEEVSEAILYNGETNLDDDDVIDAFDTCPFFPNPMSEGGQLDENNNGLGDECDCGDVDGSLVIDLNDVDAVRDFLVRGSPAGDPVEDRCSVSEGAGCDTLDAYILRRVAETSPGFGVEQRCDSALP